MGSGSATISAVTTPVFCAVAAPAIAHGAAVALGSDGFVAVVTAAIVRHRPAIHGEGVGSRRWAYGAVSVDMHTLCAGLRAQRPGWFVPWEAAYEAPSKVLHQAALTGAHHALRRRVNRRVPSRL